MTPPPAELFASRVFLGPALRAQPDRRLVDLVRDGYDSAFEEIVRRYRKQLDRFAAGIVGGRSEDVTQDAFSKALLALRGSEAEIELSPWLYRIVRNTALNDLRDRAPAADELSELLPGGRSAAAEAEAREELRDLMARLQALPEPQRAALVMRELEGLSHEEIAAALGVSGGAARQAIYRARAALREGFGLLVPLPVLRALAEHGGEVGAAGGTIAAGGALKAGMATVLIAGAVGAGVVIDHHQGNKPGPEAAEAAPLVAGRHRGAGAGTSRASGQGGNQSGTANHGRGGGGDSSGHGGGSHDGGSLGGSSGGPGPSGGSHSGEGSRHSGSGDSGSSDPGSGSGDHHGGSSGSDDLGGSSGSGSGDGGGTSGGSSSDDGFSGGGSGSDGSSGDTITEPTGEPSLDESSSDGGTSGGSDSGTSGSGSGDLTSTTTNGSDVSP
ncbi:MAG TPA: RNA polymerase sigma factor [Solirubrobacterales bacterium]